MLEGAALDPYTFTRDVYLQRRQSQIEDLIERGIGVRNGTEDTNTRN
jgi:phospholipid-binding lipoprotein MlaA